MFRKYKELAISDIEVAEFKKELSSSIDKAREYHDHIKDEVCEGIAEQNALGYYKQYDGEDGLIYRSTVQGDGIMVIAMKEREGSDDIKQITADQVYCVADEVDVSAFDLDEPLSSKALNITTLDLPFTKKIYGKAATNQVLLKTINAPQLTEKQRSLLYIDENTLSETEDLATLPSSPQDYSLSDEETKERIDKRLTTLNKIECREEDEDNILQFVNDVRTADKKNTTIEETAALYSIGENRLRRWVKAEPLHPAILWVETKATIKRDEFEKWLKPMNVFPY